MKLKLLISLMLCAGLASAQEASIPKHLEYAREIVATVKPENNRYEFTGTEGVRWEGSWFNKERSVGTMCTGFVGAMLKKSGSKAVDHIESKTYWKKYLRIENYQEAIMRGIGFDRLATINELEPGDIFLFGCNNTCMTSLGPAQGHITIVDVKPYKRAPTPPIIEGTTQWTLTIIDSADAPHDKNDTRWGADGKKNSGAGRGSFRIYTDDAGVPVGYTPGFSMRFHNMDQRPILFARVKE